MKIVGVSGSPRKGNTEWMVSRLLDLLEQKGHDVDSIIPRTMDIRPCRGCLACEKRDERGRGTCKIQDDMQAVLQKILDADLVVFGSPGYFSMLSGMLKNFMDRTCPIWPALKGKKLVGLAVAEEGVGRTIDNLKTYGLLCQMEWVGSVSTLAKLPREVARDPSVEKKLRRLAARIV
jgi:multimeric flavodoxin WrbA